MKKERNESAPIRRMDEKFMQEALREARLAYEKDEIPVGAVIVASGKIIARAHNLSELLVDSTAHAEMMAITSAENFLGSKYLNECTLYVTLEPCLMCAGAMFWSQLGTLVFGTADPKNGCSRYGISPFHPKTKVRNGILADECRRLISDYFREKRHPGETPS